ncbi:MAG: beta strand repeat-containing protein [Acidimicrobiales bacterium]
MAVASCGTGSTGGTFTNTSSGLTGTQSCLVTGLTPGVQYTFTVTPTPGTNGAGSEATASSVVFNASSQLLTPTVSNYASGTVAVKFTPDGQATTYTVTSSPAGGTCLLGTSTGSYSPLTCYVTGLTNGTAYTFTVTPSGYGAGEAASLPSNPSASIVVGSPLAPQAVSANGTSASVSWTADGVATTYVVQSENATGFSASQLQNSCSVATGAALTGVQNCTVTGLTSGGQYQFTVTPYGGNTTTLAGTTSPVTLSSNLAGPVITSAGSQTVTASFVANGEFSTYTVEAFTTQGSSAAAPTGPTGFTCVVSNATTAPIGLQTCTITGLTNLTTYYFAVTGSGNGYPSVTSYDGTAFQVTSALSALGSVTATVAGPDAVKVSFTADGSSTIYTVTTYLADGTLQTPTCMVVNSATAPTGTQSCTVTGLTAGVTYKFEVTPGGPNVSSSSAFTQLITATSPFGGAVTAANAGNGQVQVSFTASGVYSTYVVTSNPGGLTCTISNATTPPTGLQNCTVTGLTNGTSYTFTVTASGNGTTAVTSAASNAAIPGSAVSTPAVVNAGSGSVQVTFTADGVSALYTVNAYSVAGGTVSQGNCVVGNTTTPLTGSQNCTVSGLSNGTYYTFNVTPSGNNTVSAVSAMSASIEVTSQLAKPTVANAGSGAVKVTFTADGNATLYTVTSLPAGGVCVVSNTTTAPTGTQSCTVTGLTNGTQYTFTVTPSGGSQVAPSTASAPSNAILVGVSFLTTPTVAFAALGSAAVTFTADGVASTYTVNAFAPLSSTPLAVVGTCVVVNSTTPPTGSQSCTVTGLTTGTEYVFNVTPSGHGTTSLTSANSSPYIAVAAVAPGAPTGVAAAAKANSLAVSWTAPTNTGNSAITGYVVTATAGNITTSCGTVAATATSCTISGLSASTVYVVSVSAANAIGTSAAATASATTSAAPAAKNPFTHGVHGVAYVGRTVTLTISGGNFYGQPKITSNNAGTRVGVKGDTGTLLTIIVTTSANSRQGWHTFTITLANGKVCRANYDVK